MSDVQILKKVPIFQTLSKEALKKISTMVETAKYPEGATLFAEGSAGDSLYIVVEGEILILKSVAPVATRTSPKRSGETEKVIATLEQGDFFGEMALLDKVPRSASARAKGNVVVLKITTKHFWDFVKAHAAEALQMIILLTRTLSDRLRITTIESTIVYELGKIFSAGLLQKELGIKIIEQATTVLPEGTFAALSLWNEFNQEYEWVSISRSTEFLPELQRTMSRTEPIPKFLEENRSFFLSENWKKESRFQPEEKKLYGDHGGSLMAFPIFKSEINQLLPSGQWVTTCPLLGFFFYGDPKKASAFDRQLIYLLNTIAHLSATALENSAHREEEIARHQYAQRRQVVFGS